MMRKRTGTDAARFVKWISYSLCCATFSAAVYFFYVGRIILGIAFVVSFTCFVAVSGLAQILESEVKRNKEDEPD